MTTKSPNQLLKAISAAAIAHKNQRRKFDSSPYVYHPIELAHLLSDVAEITVLCNLHNGSYIIP
jgi:(p)ppGpp synthase/HD superfamily hydrolase